MLQHQNRDPDARRHDGKRGESVAHHHRQQRHTQGIDGHGDKPAVYRQIVLRQPGDAIADARGGKQQPEHREDLRQNKRPAHGIQQATSFLQRLRRRFMGHADSHHQAEQRTCGH